MNSVRFGSFTRPGVLAAMVGLLVCGDAPGRAQEGSALVLLRATPCGWEKVAETEPFNADEDECEVAHLQDRDALVCSETWGPFAGGVYESV